ncbi:unnamed protein product [Pneumocystis jirovecii]|uniref:Glucosidase 2 subunit beta n=1 Tax=Pneumocystis jirovecii TaxID=42068 RepID=L0PFP1_PNEJI|nr:unnamed protein product [Pneumocystis jirovecii]
MMIIKQRNCQWIIPYFLHILILFKIIPIFSSFFLFVEGKNEPLRGVPESKVGKSLYKSENGVWKCLNTSKYIPFSRLNDDWCDCEDGSDEPGTSACPNGVFSCKNLGHISKFIPTSYLNDGICDCCDGSDEYEGIIECKNTCEEENKKYKQEILKKKYIYDKGSKIRQEWMEKANKMMLDLKKEVKKLEIELNNAIREDQILKKQEAKEKLKKIKFKNDTFIVLFNNKFDKLFEKYNDLFMSFIQFEKENSSELSLDDVITSIEDKSRDLTTKRDTYDNYVTNLNDESKKFIKLIEEEYYLLKKKSIFDSIEEWFTHIFNKVKQYLVTRKILLSNDNSDPQCMINYETFDESNEKILLLKEKLEEKQAIMKKNAEGFNIYYAVKDETLKFKFKEYQYELTFLKNAYQISLNDNYRIFLGSFSHFDGVNKLYYHNGDQCWNGPSRSVVVELHCGIKNEIVSTIEYQRCMYFMKVFTPGACILPSYEMPKDEL